MDNKAILVADSEDLERHFFRTAPPEDWVDTYMSHAACRNILVDLLENGDKPTALNERKKIVSYKISAVGK